jgi:hypothetical protein
MILVDLSQTLMSVIFQNMKGGLNKELARSMIFMTLLSYKKQFGSKYGAPVLAIDSRNGYWRKDIFEYYKASRAKSREESKLDWNAIFDITNTVTEEIKECLPWKCVQVNKAEADDVIGVLAMKYGDLPTLILSSDKDYKQLQYKKGVVQYSPIMKKWIKSSDPKKDLAELILTGDGGDGIPNIRSAEDSIVNGTRQLPISEKFKLEFHENPAKVYRDFKDRYLMNERLIDFTKIPEHISEGILSEYDKPTNGSINKLYKLFVARKMPRMLSDIELFKVKEQDYAICTEDSFFQ